MSKNFVYYWWIKMIIDDKFVKCNYDLLWESFICFLRFGTFAKLYLPLCSANNLVGKKPFIWKKGYFNNYIYTDTVLILKVNNWLVVRMLERFPSGPVVKNLPAVQERRVQSLGGEDFLEEGMAAHSSILAWRSPGTEEPGRLQSTGLPRVRHDWSDLAHNDARTCNCFLAINILKFRISIVFHNYENLRYLI